MPAERRGTSWVGSRVQPVAPPVAPAPAGLVTKAAH